MAFLFGCENVTLEYPSRKVLDQVTLGIDEGARIGIVGRNGDGKSSLLALLAGRKEPDAFRRALDTLDRLELGITAPACGLELTRVYYEDEMQDFPAAVKE